MEIIQQECCVIGAGLAGLTSAVGLAEQGIQPLVISQVPPLRSHSAAAMGGIQAALASSLKAEGDSPELHLQDTVSGGEYMCDTDVARYFCQSIPQEIRRLDSWGVPWTRVVSGKRKLSDGTIIHEPPQYHGLVAGRNFGGTAKWRTCYCSDATGHDLMYALCREAGSRNIPVYDRCMALSLIIEDETVRGLVCLDMRKMELFAVLTKALIIASGGFGRIFARSTNGAICTGSAHDLVLQSGLGVLANMEAVQFHPTCLVPSSLLITEGCRGDGGHLLDSDGNRFMKHYSPEKMECARRDQISRAMMLHHEKGLSLGSKAAPYFNLDIRHLGKKHIVRHLREVHDLCMSRLRLDPVKECIPVFPAQHYSMGGIRTSADTSVYGLKGLFAAGEAACWDLHGFNRLGGNSLGETLVAGRLAAQSAAASLGQDLPKLSDTRLKQELEKQQKRLSSLAEAESDLSVFQALKQVQESMSDGLGVFRTGEAIQSTIDTLHRLQEKAVGMRTQGGQFSQELLALLELPGIIRISLSAAYSALARKESRGCHNRRDYPNTDETFQKRTLIRWNRETNKPEIYYEDVR